jgi:hypothetical protein
LQLLPLEDRMAPAIFPPGLGMGFDPNVIPLNGTASLEFSIFNPNESTPLTGIAFTDNLPSGLAVASPPHVLNTTGGTVTAAAGSSTISLSGATLAPEGFAHITVDVTGTTSGRITNVTSNVTSAESGPGDAVAASLNVAWNVTSPAEDGPGSLRQVIHDANDGGTIYFALPYGTWITLASPITIYKSLTLDGEDHGITISGGRTTQIFDIEQPPSWPDWKVADLKNLWLIDAHGPGGGFGRVGGAIYNGYASTLDLEHVAITGSEAGTAGGGIYNDGTLALSNCTLAGNSAGTSYAGGAIYNNGNLDMKLCDINANGAYEGGGIYNAPSASNLGIGLYGCTLQHNAAVYGGAIANYNGMYLEDCTLSDNNADNAGAGIYNAVTLDYHVWITNCTLAYNSARQAGGIGIDGYCYNMHLNNTIVADNFGGGDDVVNLGSLTGSHNLIMTGFGLSGLEDTLNADPMLGPLQWNGGPATPSPGSAFIKTRALLPGSPAIGAGDPRPNYLAFCDNRGPGYPRTRSDGSMDIGAFEVQDVTYLATGIVGGLEPLYGQQGGFHTIISFGGIPLTAGTVTFLEGSAVLAGPVPLDSNGQATFLTASLPPGAHTITVRYSGSTGFAASTYSTVMTVKPAPLTITANSTSKTYGQAVTFAGTEFTTEGLVNGDTVTGVTLTSDGTAAAAPVAGSPYAIVPSAPAGSGLSNYTITYKNGALSVNPAPLTITANNASKTYGQAMTFAGTEFTVTGLVTANGDTVTSMTLTSAGAAAAAPVPGSPYAIVPSAAAGSGLGNYSITYANGALTVKPAPLVITADPKWKITGEANPPFTVSYQGFVLGQDSSVLLGTLTFSLTATAGGYAITPGGLTSGNYAITFVSGTLTVYSYGQATNLLLTQVNAAGLAGGLQNSLDSQLLAAMASFDAGHTAAGVNQLGAFINHVRAQRGKGIDAAVADALIAFAQRIIMAVG